MASLLLSPDSPAPVGTSAEDGGGGEDGGGVDGEIAESRGVAGGVAGGVVHVLLCVSLVGSASYRLHGLTSFCHHSGSRCGN